MPNLSISESVVAPSDIRLRWVLADPSTERAVDPLGMGTQADKIADLLLPQLSVTTTRARYFSFLCWAVHKSAGSAPITAIHRLEAELALEEAIRHNGESANTCPGVVGRTLARRFLDDHKGKPPVRPERLYKNTAFATYRPTMRALGLLTHSRRPELTTEGMRLATEFGRCCGRKLPCLGDISVSEQGLLKKLLGLDYRRQSDLPVASMRRRATFEAVRQHFEDRRDSKSVLEQFAQLSSRPADVESKLHRAFVWELLSCGLALAFSMLLTEQRKPPIVRALRQALVGRPRRPAIGPLSARDPECGGQVVALLRAAMNLNPQKLMVDPGPAGIAARLVDERDPDAFLCQLVERHRMAKPEAPWVRLVGEKVEILAHTKSLAFQVRPRTYRLDAFSQLLRDLGMIQ